MEAISPCPPRILIVEDNTLIAMNLGDMLQLFGAEEIQIVSTVADALSELESREFDLAIIDIQLGEESGFVVAKCCAHIGVPVIISTGFGEVFKSAASSTERFLNKPYTVADLQQILSELDWALPRSDTGSASASEV
jgi:DNA-binding NtrC family response regulator